MNTLEKRIIELSFKHQLSHISSCLNVINLLDWIYNERKDDEPVCLDNSHAALALYVVLEKHEWCDAEEMIKLHGTHAGRDSEHGIWVSGGSLGQVATVAVGFALADKNRKVWLITSDGACMEGAIHEAIRFSNQSAPNLKTYIVFNGFGAYGKVFEEQMPRGLYVYLSRVDERHYPEWLRGLDGHYLKLNQQQLEELMA